MGETRSIEIPGVRAFAEGVFVKPFLHSGVTEAYEEAAAAVGLRTPVVAVTGPVGCGRTTIATAAAGVIKGAIILDLSASDGDFACAAAALLGGKREELPRLLAEMEADEVIFLVDGPAVVKAEAFADQLSLILQLAGRPAVFILAGDSEALEEALHDKRMALRGPVTVEVGPMRPDEVESYLRHRLSEADLPEDVFSGEASMLLGTASAGVPARINAIARRALAAAWTSGSSAIGIPEVSTALAQPPPDGESNGS